MDVLVVRFEISFSVLYRFTVLRHDCLEFDRNLDIRRIAPNDGHSLDWTFGVERWRTENQVNVPVGRASADREIQLINDFASLCLLPDLRAMANEVVNDRMR
jgi:hypothetical protein